MGEMRHLSLFDISLDTMKTQRRADVGSISGRCGMTINPRTDSRVKPKNPAAISKAQFRCSVWMGTCQSWPGEYGRDGCRLLIHGIAARATHHTGYHFLGHATKLNARTENSPLRARPWTDGPGRRFERPWYRVQSGRHRARALRQWVHLSGTVQARRGRTTDRACPK